MGKTVREKKSFNPGGKEGTESSLMSPDSRGGLLLGKEKETHLLKSLSPTQKKEHETGGKRVGHTC